ncbi:MAG TPA: DUF4143 domain-containing protein [Polyangiaceae bacterium]
MNGNTTSARDRGAQQVPDALTGRKREVWLVPMISADLADFHSTDIGHRMLRGGLPPFFLARRLDDKDFEEWLSSYWAKDLSELFVVDKRAAFNRFIELVFAQSGGQFEAQAFAGPCEISRPTVQQYLSILETTLLATTVRPYFGGGATEIKSQPKVYAFDTGFVAYFKEWDSLRDPDRGLLLEHLVLGELCARFDLRRIHYWRDKQHHEVDFVLESGRRREPIAIEARRARPGSRPRTSPRFGDAIRVARTWSSPCVRPSPTPGATAAWRLATCPSIGSRPSWTRSGVDEPFSLRSVPQSGGVPIARRREAGKGDIKPEPRSSRISRK